MSETTHSENQDQSADELKADDDLSAGFAMVQEQSSPEGEGNARAATDAPATREASTAAAAPSGNSDAAAAAGSEATVAGRLPDLTPDEIRAGFEKLQNVEGDVRKAFGRFGELNRTVQEIQQKLENGSLSAGGRRLLLEDLRHVNEELPGLGDALVKDLAPFFGGSKEAAAAAIDGAQAPAGQSFNADDYFASTLSPALQTMEARLKGDYEMRLVTFMHKDFSQVCGSKDFQTWGSKLPPDQWRRIVESDDATVAGQAVTDFKEWKRRSEGQRNRNSQRLEDATVPQGGGSAPMSHPNDDDAEFGRGFNAVAKKRA